VTDGEAVGNEPEALGDDPGISRDFSDFCDGVDTVFSAVGQPPRTKFVA